MNKNIPVVILCGGRGTRINELTAEIPKPLIKVGNEPVLWHIMKIYSSRGYSNFILCLGYKGEKIRDYFSSSNNESWNIKFVDTGLKTTKSQRIAQIKDLIETETFFLAYGDDVADIDLDKLLDFHQENNSLATITVVKMASSFGIVEIDDSSLIKGFKEKPSLDIWMNGGFMVLQKKIVDYLSLGELEKEVFSELIKLKQLRAYKHQGQWKTLNTLKDNMELNKLWEKNEAFWKKWGGK